MRLLTPQNTEPGRRRITEAARRDSCDVHQGHLDALEQTRAWYEDFIRSGGKVAGEHSSSGLDTGSSSSDGEKGSAAEGEGGTEGGAGAGADDTGAEQGVEVEEATSDL